LPVQGGSVPNFVGLERWLLRGVDTPCTESSAHGLGMEVELRSQPLHRSSALVAGHQFIDFRWT
jgi:hypothetical protein